MNNRIRTTDRPQWKLPLGVSKGTWDYAQLEHIATDYDDYFAFNDLFELDETILGRAFSGHSTSSQPVVADLGAGTGRALVPLARKGFRGLAIDLSRPMLNVVRSKAAEEALPIQCLRCNLVDLDAVATASVDYAMCLFSTLGMIRGSGSRQQALYHAHRILRPGGVFVLHVHNLWYNLYDPGGPWWLLKNLADSLLKSDIERGDKYYPYRGVANMYLHVFTRRELTRLLATARLVPIEYHSLHRSCRRTLRCPWLLGRIRALGWIVVCRAK